MSRSWLILIAGLVLGVGAFAGLYYAGTAECRSLMDQPQPELAWLKKEFNLSDAEFARITALHEAYLPQCAERCRLIEEQNTKLRGMLAQGGAVTTEIESVLAQRAKTRAQCEAEMLKHFQEVSRAMPPEQGRRYLAWVQEQTILRAQSMEARHKGDAGHHPGTGPHS